MFSFFRRKKSIVAVPEWAHFFSNTDYQQFVGHVETYLKAKKVAYLMGSGEIIIRDGSFGADRMGLMNLAQACAQVNPSRWKKMIYDHFDGIQKANVFHSEFEKQCHDFAYAQPYIGVRLYHKDYVASLDSSLIIGKPLSEDVFAMLVFDLPYSVMNVKPEQTIQWNRTNEELFEIGVDNIRKKYRFDITQQDMGDIKIYAIQNDHFFTPNIVFELDQTPGFVGKQGALVGIPHRHTVLIFPINDLKVVQAISMLCPIIHGMNAEGPGSVSESLYWYHEKQFKILPYTMESSNLQFYPPESFVEILDELDRDI